MLDFIKNYQIYILMYACAVCVVQALYLLLIRGQSPAKKHTLIAMQVCVGILLVADSLALIYNGNPSRLAFWLVRICKFIVFANNYLSIALFGLFLTYTIMESGKLKKIPTRLSVCLVVQGIAIIHLLVSLITHWYYSFDEMNFYHRETLLCLSFVFPFISVVLQSSLIFSYRKYFGADIIVAVVAFAIMMLVAGVAQLFIEGLSLVSLAMWVSACLIFALILSDQNHNLVKAAHVEMYTGLPNTHGFIEQVNKIIAYKDITDYNGFYFDIKRMGLINEKYGKDRGDQLIYTYSHQIRKLIDSDEILARLGGNYFTALIKKENTEKFLKILSNVPVDLEVTNSTDTVHVAAWAGIYEIVSKHVTPGQIIGDCATALTYAKNVAHIPYAYLDKDLEERLRRQHELEESTRIGLGKNEFEAFYQPKVDSRTNTLCGAEALARWYHKGEVVLPSEFVPVMEKIRSICDLDFLILRNVCKDISEWLDMGLKPVPVSINFSRRNLEDPCLADRINDVVEEYGVPKDLIQIEITETIDEYSMEVLAEFVDSLRQHGFKAAIDHFGVGSSSINLLNQVKFDVIKIDRAFAAYSDEKSKLLMQNIIRMVNDIGLDAIAEGVEDKAQVEELKSMNCFTIQGFAYSKPIDKSDYVKLLVNSSLN